MAIYDSYIICTSARSGSTLLCDILKSTEVCGRPESYFHRPAISSCYRHLDIAIDESHSEQVAIAEIFKLSRLVGAGKSGLFGLRMQGDSFDYFASKLAVLYPDIGTVKKRIESAFGRTAFIHLTRINKIEQAVSWVKADQTGLWHITADGQELERIAPPTKLAYDPEAIAKHKQTVEELDQNWQNWFMKEDIDPLRITYEDLSVDPTKTLREILNFLGLDCVAANGIKPNVAKLADQVSRDWVRRFSDN